MKGHGISERTGETCVPRRVLNYCPQGRMNTRRSI
jgi:hypothetical protein